MSLAATVRKQAFICIRAVLFPCVQFKSLWTRTQIGSLQILAAMATSAITHSAFVNIVAFVFIARKQETTAAVAFITSFCIVTDLIAASVIGGTLVYVCTVCFVLEQFVSRITFAFHPLCTKGIDATAKENFPKMQYLEC